MKKRIRRILKHKLIGGSFVLMAGTFIGGASNYLYHLLMGRMLGPTDYGVLASLISLTYLLAVPMGALGLAIVKFVSAFRGEKKIEKVGILFRSTTKKLLPFSFLFLLVLSVFSPFIVSFLHLNSVFPFLIIVTTSFVGIFSTVNGAILQGLLRFGYVTAIGVTEMGLKLIVGVLLVVLGFKVNGALFGLLIGAVIAYFLSFYPLRSLPSIEKEKDFRSKPIITFILPVFFSILSFTSLYTIDIVLARHFLTAEEAGFYSALANLGKIIFFISGPVVSVMFPLISERYASGKRYYSLLLASLGLVAVICLIVTGVYFLLPELMVEMLYGSAYLAVAAYLGLFGIFISFYSLSFLLNRFYLSIGRVKMVGLPVLAAVIQMILILILHRSIKEIIFISIIINAALFLSEGIFLFYGKERTN